MKRFMLAVMLIFMSVAAHAQGTWSTVQSVAVPGMTHGIMYYQYLLLNYNATGSKATILVYEHQNDYGNGCYPGGNCAGLATGIAGQGGTGVNAFFNNASFQNRYCANGCIVVQPYADQTSDPSGITSNFGGYNDQPGTEPNERGVIAVIQQVLSTFNANANGVLVTGDSLGGIGSQAIGLDYGVGTGTQGHIITATMPFSGAIYRNGLNAPTNAQVAQIQGGGVQFNVNGTGDTSTSSNPTLWAEPLWNAIGGSPTNLTPPPAAAAAGYTTRTFGPTIKYTPNIGADPFAGGTAQWTRYAWDFLVAADVGVAVNSDGSISMDGSGQGYGNGITTGAPSGFQTTFDPLHQMQGQSFGGGGYFEAVMKSAGGMSMWAVDAEQLNSFATNLIDNPWPGQPITVTFSFGPGLVSKNGDVLTLVAYTTSLAGFPITISHTTVVGESLAQMATFFANAFTGNAAFHASGATATASGATITFNQPHNLIPAMGVTYNTSFSPNEAVAINQFGNWLEMDMAEFDFAGVYGGAMHNWYQAPGANQAVNTVGSGSPFVSSGVDFSQYHTFGYLWVPATSTTQGYIQFYFNNQQVGNRITWNKYNPLLDPPPTQNGTYSGGGSAYSIADVDHFVPILGGGCDYNVPMGQPPICTTTTIQSYSVWQKDGTNDVPVISASAAGYPGPPNGGRAQSSPLYFLLDPNLGHDVWDTYRTFPAAQPMLDVLFAQVTPAGGGGSTGGSGGAPLSSGYLHVVGNQVVDGAGNNVRLACTAYDHPTASVSADLTKMRTQGFNCARVPWFDKVTCPGGACNFTSFDAIVAAATANNMRIIFDHQSNEGVDGSSGCTNQQANGLWYDLNGTAPWTATNGTDGCGTAGTVTYAQFKANWVAFGTHYNANSTVIGFDLHNEPTTFGNPACCATTNGGTGAFQVKNGQILTPSGSVFRAVGPNIYWNTTTMSQLCPTSACTPLLTNFPGINFIRCVWENGYNQSGMEPYIGYLTALNIVVMIADFNAGVGQPALTGSALTTQVNWYGGIATTYANNAYVWEESQNEMYGASGATMAASETALYNAVRAQSNTKIVVLEYAGGGGNGTVGSSGNIFYNGAFQGQMPASTFTVMHNVIWDLHFYGYLVNEFVGSYSTDLPTIQNVLNGSVPVAYGIIAAQSFGSNDGIMPVLIGESGNSTTGLSLDPNGAQIVQAACTNPNTTGCSPFAAGTYAIGVTCCNAITDGNSNLTNPYGVEVANLVAANGSGRAPATPSAFGAAWGGTTNNGTDAKVMTEDIGAALQAADPGSLLIVEGIYNNGTLFNGTTRGSSAFPITAGSIGDLSSISTRPVTCCTGHVLYSVHDMPTSVFNVAPDSGTAITTMRNTAWGYLETSNTAPVWIGKMGADLDNTNGQLSDENAWATGLTQYMNGSLGNQGGPTFTGCQRPMAGDWYTYGYIPGAQVDGTLNSDGTNKTGQQAFWNTLAYTVCTGGGGGGGGTTVQATRVNDFANSIGMNTQVQNASAVYTNGSGMVADLNYLGVRQLRDGTLAATTGTRLNAMTTLANNGFHWTIYPTTGGANPYSFVIATSLTNAKTIDALVSPHALTDLEMFNQPINFGVTYTPCGTGGGGSAWTCVATADNAYYTAIKADSQVGTLPTWSATTIGSETPNVGMQFLTIPTGTAATFPAGTKYADAYNIQIFPFFQTAVGLIDPSATAHDQLQFQLTADFVTTSAGAYPGLPLATVLASPHVVTEFGLSSTTQVDARTKAVNLANGFADAYFLDGFSTAYAYELYEEGDGYGYNTTTGTPTLAATYMHNFTSAISDGGATAATFSPGTLTYSLANLPTNAHSTLMQASNGHFKMVVWSNEHNYNLGTSTPIVIAQTSVTLTLTSAANVMTFDNTLGDVTAPTQTLTNVTTVNFPISDHIEVIDISAPCTVNCGGGGGGVGATSWNPADQSGMTLTGSNLIATSAAGHSNVRSTTSQTTGKVCWEVVATTITGDWDAGLSNATYSITGLLGGDGNGIGFDPNTGAPQGVFYNNATLSTGPGVSPNGEKEDFCADLDAHLFWVTNATQRGNGFTWNNSATANPATGTGGLAFTGMPCPCFITFNDTQAGGVATLNAVGPLAVALPSGFSFWQAPVVSGSGRPFFLTAP